MFAGLKKIQPDAHAKQLKSGVKSAHWEKSSVMLVLPGGRFVSRTEKIHVITSLEAIVLSSNSNRLQQGFILLVLAIVAAGFIGMIRSFLIALVLAAIFSGLLYPLYRRILAAMNNRAIPASATMIIACVIAVGLPLAGLIGMIASEAIQISEQFRPVLKGALAGETTLSGLLPDWLPYADRLEPYHESILTKVAEAASAMGRWLVSNLSVVTQGTLDFFLSLFVMVYAMFYFFMHGPQLLKSLQSLIPLSSKDRDLVLNRGLSVTQASLKGILVIGATQGLLLGIAFWAAGITGPAFWGSIVFLLSAIPGLGAPLVWIPAAIYLIAIGSMGWGIAMIVWGIVVVGLIDNLLRPMLVGRDTRLPDIVVLVSILGGIASFGPIGIILGPVIAAMFDTVLEIYRRIFQNQLPG